MANYFLNVEKVDHTDLDDKVVYFQVGLYARESDTLTKLEARLMPARYYDGELDSKGMLLRFNTILERTFDPRPAIVYSTEVTKWLQAFKGQPETILQPNTVLVTSFLRDSQSFEFTTMDGVYRVKERHDLNFAMIELLNVLRDNGITVDNIKLA